MKNLKLKICDCRKFSTMKSNHSLNKYRSANLSNGTDSISNELIQECRICLEQTRLSAYLREKLERQVYFDNIVLFTVVPLLLSSSNHFKI